MRGEWELAGARIDANLGLGARIQFASTYAAAAFWFSVDP